MIFEVECDKRRTNELTDRTEHTMIVSFIVLDMDGEYCSYEYLDRMAPCVYRSRYWHWVPRAQRSGGWTPNWSTLRTSHWLSTVLDINVDIIYTGDIRVCTHGWREARAGLRRRTRRRGTAPTRWAPTSRRGTPWTLHWALLSTIYYVFSAST